MKCRNLFLLVLFTSLLTLTSVMAQTPGTGALTGTVKDPSGAVIPNATVTLTSVDTGQARTTMTGADGVYRFTLLPPGNYRVRIESSGFKPLEVPSVTVAVTETAVLDRNLEVGAQAQTVTVEGEVENIQTASSALGTVVNTRSVVALPLSTRNYTNLLAMNAGANAGVTNSTTLGKAATGIAVNGGDIGQNTYLQDGVAVNTWFSTNTTQEGTNAGAFPTPNPDAIQEFKVQTANYDSSFGRNPGGNVDVITKSGTNNFHGSAFEFFRNTSLNANDYFFNATAAPGTKPQLNQNQFGGTFGGPVKKDKLFLFAGYQETIEKNGIAGFGFSVVNLSPIPNMPRGNCPLSATSVAGCDATAQAFAAALGAAVCPGNNPGNRNDKVKTSGSVQVACNGSNINPVALRIMQLQSNGQFIMPGAYTVSGGSSAAGAGLAAQYPLASFTDPATFHDHQGMGNWDYVINNKHTLSGRYFFEQDPTNGNFASNGTRITATNILPGFPVFEQKTNHAALLRLTSVLSSNLVNEARVSYQRVIAVANNLDTFTNSQVGITDLTPGLDNFSEVSINGLYSFGSNTAFGLHNTSNQFEGADQVSWTHGVHSFRFGAEGQHVITNYVTPGSSYMNVSFKSFPDFLLGWPACSGAPGPVIIPGTVTCGGVPTNRSTTASNVKNVGGPTVANGPFQSQFRINYIDAFVQDDIKVTPRFTLNAGVRWEWDGFPTTANGITSTYRPSLALASPVPGNGCVVNGVAVGAGATGTGCSLAGFVVPNNFPGTPPAGVFKNTTPYISQTTPPWHNFSPRLGFAWQPLSSNRFVVRGGGGFFYELINGMQSAGFPMRVAPGVLNVPSSPLASWQNPGVLPAAFPGPPGSFGFPPLWANPATGQTSNVGQSIIPQDLTTPLTYEWNLNAQYEFLPNWVLELGYVGSHGIRQEQGGSVINAIDWNSAQLITPTSPLNTINQINCDNVKVYCNTSASANLRTPFLGMSTNSRMFPTNGAYRYDALLVTLRKQFSKGLQMQVSYTWDKGLITQGYGINTPPYDVLQLGPNADYHPQRVVINYVWNLPVHLNGWQGRILNDWSWAGVTTIQDGVPFTVYDGNSGAAFFQGGVAGDTYGPALICPGVAPLTSGPIETRLGGSLSPNGYLNTAAFSDGTGAACSLPIAPGDDPKAKSPAFMYGNIGLGTYLSPGQYNWDMSLSKLIHIQESKTLEFRGEFFNTFNHPQFSFNPVDDPAFAAQDSSVGNFGQVTVSSVNPRLIQFVLKFQF